MDVVRGVRYFVLLAILLAFVASLGSCARFEHVRQPVVFEPREVAPGIVIRPAVVVEPQVVIRPVVVPFFTPRIRPHRQPRLRPYREPRLRHYRPRRHQARPRQRNPRQTRRHHRRGLWESVISKGQTAIVYPSTPVVTPFVHPYYRSPDYAGGERIRCVFINSSDRDGKVTVKVVFFQPRPIGSSIRRVKWQPLTIRANTRRMVSFSLPVAGPHSSHEVKVHDDGIEYSCR